MKIAIELNREGHEYNTLKIEARYTKGGMNCSNYKEEPRGIYVHVRPTFIKHERGFQSESCMLFAKDGGFKMLVKPLKRLSTKKVNAVQEALNGLDESRIKALFMASDEPSRELASMLQEASDTVQ